MNKRTLLIFIFLHTIFVPVFFAQILIKELPDGIENRIPKECLNSSELRPVFPLFEDWQVYPTDEPENKTAVSVPNYFQGADDLTYEYSFDLSKEQIERSDVELHFLGVNYFGDIYVNGQRVYRHNNGLIPFSVTLPREILKFTSPNVIVVNVKYQLDSDNTFPPKNRFLGSKLAGGIVRGVYLQFVPLMRFENLSISYKLNSNLSSAEVELRGSVYNNESFMDSLAIGSLSLNFKLIDPSGVEIESQKDAPFENLSVLISQFSETISVESPALWSPEVPNSYELSIELVRGGKVIDKFNKSIHFYSFVVQNGRLKLNNFVYTLYGFIYRDWMNENGMLYNPSTAKKLIKFVKEIGFNSVRFTDTTPHPAFLEACAENGLICFVDVPLNSPIKAVSNHSVSSDRMTNYIDGLIDAYAGFDIIAAFGVGSSYTGLNGEINFISSIASELKAKSGKLVYGSFTGIPPIKIPELDLSGTELYAVDPADYENRLASFNASEASSLLFFSDIVYPANEGNSSGYTNKYSFEAQAKYFNDVFDFVRKNKLPGLFFNSVLDVNGEYNSLFNSYNEECMLVSGITDKLSNTNRLAYKVIKSKINKTEKVTIPVGLKKSDFPLFFLITALALSISMTLVINSKRKFREETTRALLRPYNFFADIRDQRILTDLHANFLMVIIAGTNSLLVTNLLYFFRQNILLEKILLSFGSAGFVSMFSYLAYHPVQAFFSLLLAGVVMVFVTSGIFKLASSFVKNRVDFISIYSSVTWAFLPVVLLLPVLLVLYRVLSMDAVNIYIYAGIGLYLLWMMQRLIKGIFVIFDVRPAFVYLSVILALTISIGSVLLYFELTESTVSAIVNSFSQYTLIRPGL